MLPKNVEYALNKLKENGFEAYLVGGCVRDKLLNKNPEDYDKLNQGDNLTLTNVFEGMDKGEITLLDETTGESFTLVCSFTERQKAILKAGGLLSFTKKGE